MTAKTSKLVPFNKPYMTGRELDYIAEARLAGQLAGDGAYTARAQSWLEQQLGANRALLTHSCTAALEMTALLLDLQPGDEIIMPSYTFVSTASAYVLRGAVPVFVDIRPDTLNIDETLLEEAITPRTRAIVVVHYAGVSCEMDAILRLANQRDLLVIEDAAQGIMSRYRGKPLGSLGDMATLSFHETKNIISGEGGALLLNKPQYIHSAEIIREKGTDRSQFSRGEVDRYTWQSVGSSYLPGEMVAAFLSAQLEAAKPITEGRMQSWNYYHQRFEQLEDRGLLSRPVVPEHCQHNAHIYYLLLPDQQTRDRVLRETNNAGINTVFHYVPLHSSPAGTRYGRAVGELRRTENLAARVLRLPLWSGISESEIDLVCETVEKSL